MPFPHENEAARNQQAFKEMSQLAMKQIAVNVVTAVTLVVVPVASFLWYRKHR